MKKISVFLAVLLAATLLLAACNTQSSDLGSLSGSKPQTGTPGVVGTILLSVNPEIEVEYDDQGLVVALNGLNADGKALLKDYTDYKGKTCAVVVSELVSMIYKSGRFELELDGHAKNIVIKLEEGSAYPDEAFLEQVAQSVQAAVEANGAKSETMVVENKDLDNKGRIGIEKAKELVLAQLGLAEADFTEKDYELDDGVYELEFTVGDIEYEYEVDAYTGKILKADYEKNDDWDYDRNEHNQPVNYTLEQAKQIVFEKLGITEADVKYPKYDLDDGKYEIDFWIGSVEYEIDVDANTGKILKIEQDDERYDDDYRVPADGQRISAEEAKALAFAYFGVSADQARRVECELDDGKYEIEFTFDGMEYDAEVDAYTGKILEADKDWDD